MGRVALVTGGSRGIGKMIAQGFLEQGAKVYITARKAEACDATAKELSEYGECISLPNDLGTVAGCRHFASQVAERESAIEILVNNAGAAWGAPFKEYPESGWDKTMDLNVKSLFFLTQSLHDPLKAAASANKPAKVINIASIDGVKINPWETYAYQASKAAVIQLTLQQAAELGEKGIRANVIAPGPVRTKLAMAVHTQDIIDAYHDAIPLNRYGTEEELANAIWFLCSPDASYITGQLLSVDGGFESVGIGLPALRK